ncbi:MAG TPA: YhcH/YjgK/YiaL family protein, partial [Porphyromonadaceae bacterium]|nr:YhcH/YjgK/YiaL family protein [Porphyromonadaceae bacterium]
EIHTGTILLNETGLKASTVETTLREKKDAKLETHRKFIDIQIPLTHAETFGWKTAGKLYPADNAYDESNDIEFYTDAPSTYVTVSPEEFVIFFPEDAHAPLIGEGQIKKIIVKVPVV